MQAPVAAYWYLKRQPSGAYTAEIFAWTPPFPPASPLPGPS